jgi:hypothetical protein
MITRPLNQVGLDTIMRDVNNEKMIHSKEDQEIEPMRQMW